MAVRKMALGVVVAVVAHATGAAAQPAEPVADSQPEAAEEERPLEVVVRGKRPGTRGTTVEKVDRVQLERFGATSVSEALDRLSSSISAYSSRGERIVSLRGFEQRQLLVTIDGVPIQVPYDGQLDLGKFPLGLVSHITVVKGAGSLLYGPNGLGGAIDIATRRPGEGPAVVFATESAPFFAQRMSGVATGRQGPISLLGGAAFENVRYFPMSESFAPTYNEDGGRRENSDRRSLTSMGKARWELDDHNEVVASAWRLDGRFGVPPGVFDLTRRYWRWTDWHVNAYAVAHGYRDLQLTVDETFFYSAVGNTLDAYDDERYATQSLDRAWTSTYDDRTVGVQSRLSYRLTCSDGRCLTIRAWVGGKRDWHRSQADAGEPWIAADTTTLTAAGQIDGLLGERLAWLAGMQVDIEVPGEGARAGRPDNAYGVGPMGALSWQPLDAVDITASAAHRTRFPTLKERFSSAFGDLEPNPSLAPERATNLSVDATYRQGRALRVDVGVFDSEVRDLVIRAPLSSQVEQWQNAGRGRFYGVEGLVRARPLQWLELWGGWTWMKARRLDLEPPEDAIAYHPAHKGTIALTLLPVSRVALTLVGRYVGEQRFLNMDTSAWGTLGASRLLDARVDLRALDGLRVWVRGANITDTNVQGRYSFPEPGRQVFAGASLAWPDWDDSSMHQGRM